MDDTSPQRFGRADNALITTFSLDQNGRNSPRNPSEGSARDGTNGFLTGSITAYAQGDLVTAAKTYFPNSFFRQDLSGSSLAGPQVAGLAAYFFGVPGARTLNAMEMKNKIVSLCRGNYSPDAPGLIYNGVHELVCPQKNIISGRGVKELSVRDKGEMRVKRQDQDAEFESTIIFADGQIQIMSRPSSTTATLLSVRRTWEAAKITVLVPNYILMLKGKWQDISAH